MFLRAESKGVDIDTGIGCAGVVLVRLDHIEVGPLTLGETVLAIELELGGDTGILTPAVHIEGGLGENEGTRIGDEGTSVVSTSSKGGKGSTTRRCPLTLDSTTGRESIGTCGVSECSASRCVRSTSQVEETRAGNHGLLSPLGSECVDRIGEGINRIRVVEGLGAEGVEEDGPSREGRAVVNILIRLHDPDELLAGVVEIQLYLVTGTSHTLIAGKLDLLEKILVGVLGHLAALVSVQENIVNIEGGSNKGLLVGHRRGHGGAIRLGQRGNRPQALTDGAEIKVDLHLVVLQGNKGKGKSRVLHEPELEGNVEGGLREGVTGSAHLVDRSSGSAGTRDTGKSGISDVGKLSGVTNHLEVSTALFRGHSELVPDVHPITVLAINALASNLDLNGRDELLTNIVEPTGIVGHRLVDLGESHLEVSAVAQVTVATDRAGNTATEIGLTREGLLDRLHREVGMASVRHLPESDLRGSSKEDILGAIGD